MPVQKLSGTCSARYISGLSSYEATLKALKKAVVPSNDYRAPPKVVYAVVNTYQTGAVRAFRKAGGRVAHNYEGIQGRCALYAVNTRTAAFRKAVGL